MEEQQREEQALQQLKQQQLLDTGEIEVQAQGLGDLPAAAAEEEQQQQQQQRLQLAGLGP